MGSASSALRRFIRKVSPRGNGVFSINIPSKIVKKYGLREDDYFEFVIVADGNFVCRQVPREEKR
jgi:antitoxin component of MazEF toxin-antitoxin module